jgi:hypothetical protein
MRGNSFDIEFMNPKLIFFCFSLILCIEISCKDKVTICKSNIVDSTFRYTEEEFEKLCKKIENKILDMDRLECKFKSVYSTEANGGLVNYAFILRMSSQAIDTCWGVINYDTNTKMINNCGVFCQ